MAEHPAAKALADAALQQAKTDEPAKAAIGANLNSAIEIAKTSLGWAELATHLAPHVQTVTAWLGRHEREVGAA
jgi:hypothetical protein